MRSAALILAIAPLLLTDFHSERPVGTLISSFRCSNRTCDSEKKRRGFSGLPLPSRSSMRSAKLKVYQAEFVSGRDS